ncbi:MAG: class I SAM-dependent methyltransferase [Desulfomonilaceae bacterium]|nr:class I SAM-dependent methyltransferase [Desulfomonilaceae bacterium]
MESLTSAVVNESDFQAAHENVQRQLKLFAELGVPVGSDAVILDFGCGKGNTVYAYRKLGYKAFGVDIELRSSFFEQLLRQEGLCTPDEEIFRSITTDDHAIPFDADSFDYVVSSVVFEHVQDYSRALSEIRRVLKQGGKSFHSFPSRYTLVEPHVHVPFATVIRNYAYLYLWFSTLGRTQLKGRSVKEAASSSSAFLKNSTNYLTKKQIVQHVNTHFGNIEFVGKQLWKNSTGRYKILYDLLSKFGFIKAVPLAAFLHSAFGRRSIFFVK